MTTPAKKTLYRCGGRHRKDERGEPICDHEEERVWPWKPPCPKCGGFYEAEPAGRSSRSKEITFAAEPPKSQTKRISTKIEDLDRVLDGGLVPGTTMIFGGKPGSGKTTLAIQVANNIATEKHPVYYASKEQTSEQVVGHAKRIRCRNPHVRLVGDEGNMHRISKRIVELHPLLSVLDSVQKIARESGVAPGYVVDHFIQVSRDEGVTILLISQVTNDMGVVGGLSLEHDVDAVAWMSDYDIDKDMLRLREGRELTHEEKYRAFVIEKNRNGPEESMLFRMSAAGLSVVRKQKFRLRKKSEVEGEGGDESAEESAL